MAALDTCNLFLHLTLGSGEEVGVTCRMVVGRGVIVGWREGKAVKMNTT
jgi:hypothetical protein